MDTEHIILSRLQFGATASFHIIFPSLIIGLSFYLTAVKAMWLRTGNNLYELQYRYWCNFLGVAFIFAIVTGIVLSYQLDTLFNGLYDQTREVLLPIRKFEFLNLMLLEAGSIGIMVLGREKVGDRLHFIATLTFTLGVIVAGVCILSRNSWMQTPAGVVFENGDLMVEDWGSVILNPSFPYVFFHVILAALLSTAFVILGLSAWYLLHDRHLAFSRFGLKFTIVAISILAPLQLLSGHLQGTNTRDHQPVKLAAIEGLWETTKGAPLVLFAIPDEQQETNHYALEIPGLASLVITHDLDGEVRGLKSVPPADRPNVPIVFFSFRIMVAAGILMLGLACVGLVLIRRRRLFSSTRFLRACLWMTPAGLIATIAGWCVAEAGRQPWVAYGLIRTVDVIHPATASQVEWSLTIFGLTYCVLLVIFLSAVWRLVSRGVEQSLIHAESGRIIELVQGRREEYPGQEDVPMPQ